jgi:hypothetical protein
MVWSTRDLYWKGLHTAQGESLFNLGVIVLLNPNPKSTTSFRELYYAPEPGIPVITIRMPDGKFIPANDLNRNTLAPYIAAGTASEYKDSLSIHYSRGAVYVSLDERGDPKQVHVDVGRGCTHSEIQGKPPALSIPDGTTVLEFPLQEKEFKKLFGTPTRDERETYVGPLLV